jgi:hypothetical protein
MRYEQLLLELDNGTINVGDDMWYTFVHFQLSKFQGKSIFSTNIRPVKVRLTLRPLRFGHEEDYLFRGISPDGTTDNQQFYYPSSVYPPADFPNLPETFATEEEAWVEYKRQVDIMRPTMLDAWDQRIQKLENLKARLILEPDKETSL